MNKRSSQVIRELSCEFSVASGLEAFNPTQEHRALGPLVVQLSPLMNGAPNSSSRTKLDCCFDNDFISRVKLTCLTTV